MVFVATALPFLLAALSQPSCVGVPDGNVRKLSYDVEGNVLAVKDQHYDVAFTYQGMGRLASRTQEGTTVRFEYDTNESPASWDKHQAVPSLSGEETHSC